MLAVQHPATNEMSAHSANPLCFLYAIPQGYGLIEAVLEQQGRQSEGVEGHRSAQLPGGVGRRPWELGFNGDDSDDEAAGGLAGTFVGGGSPCSPRSPGSPSALLAAASPSAAAAAAAAAASSKAAAARLADLHAAAAGIHTVGFAEMLWRVVPVRRPATPADSAAGTCMSRRAPLVAAPNWLLAPLPRQPFFAA